MFSGRLWELFIDSFPKILIPGLTVTIPLTVISFTFALIIAVIMALVQFANVKVLKQIARFYIWIFSAPLSCKPGLKICLQSSSPDIPKTILLFHP